jgi:hypothetical protein
MNSNWNWLKAVYDKTLNIFATNSVTKLQIEDFIPWLEKNLLEFSIIELEILNEYLFTLENSIQTLKNYSNDYRHSLNNSFMNQSSKIQKIFQSYFIWF